MSSYVTRIDGTDDIEVRKDPSDYVKGLPTMTQWKLWHELTRPLHAKVLGEYVFFVCICCGSWFKSSDVAAKSYLRLYSNQNAYNERFFIRVGAKVRKETTRYEVNLKGPGRTIYKEQSPITVMKRGPGCPSCFNEFTKKQSEAMRQHEIADRMDAINAQIALLSGCAECKQQREACQCKKYKPTTFKATARMEPHILVLDVIDCNECKGTHYVWNSEAYNSETKQNGKYVLCHCYEKQE